MDPEQQENGGPTGPPFIQTLRRELRRLEEFRVEVAALAATKPNMYVTGWGTAAWTLKVIDREIIAIEREIVWLALTAK
jgi:hypothetical protein